MNLLIVDDQKQVVSGILSGVNWGLLPEIHNILYAYTAADAKRIFTNQTIDILVSDIEMPGEDGIALVNWVKDHFPETKCLFLTAHANFDYAQTALKLNCVDYILQPVKYEILTQALEKTVSMIIAQRKDQELMNYNSFWNNHKDELVSQTWMDYISQPGPSVSALYDKLHELGVTLPSDGDYTLLFLMPVVSKSSLDDWINHTTLQQLEKYISDFFSQFSGYQCPVKLSDHDILYLINCKFSSEELYGMTQTFMDLCHNNYDMPLAVWLGTPSSLNNLPASYKQLAQLKSQSLAVPNRLFTLSDQPKAFSTPLPFSKYWSGSFISGHTEDIEKSLKEYIDQNAQNGSLNAMLLLTLQQYFIHAFLTSLQERSIRFRKVMEQKEVYEALTFSTRSVEDFIHFVHTIININREFINNKTENNVNLIELAQKYISDHISDDLSRQTIAEAIHVSESYLSHMFQKNLGISLVEYITSQRMELAKSMLSNTSMPIQLIAIKTGYNNVSYFIKTFKKAFDLTPAEYRKQLHK